ncbi:DUF4249 family protein [Marinoscillum furvescens]|uniref:Uncharacterized protein DUF4249 n=1 Tax=Marinoscillum furvescens DSM 4134 TaxID=1122208 RepID=A0A3D9LIL3_MARFU|nr:DUF4249 family protein [Marinoscillum furvescens]REE05663.1 uncharacterized protein DUF4249 [Marinoscillum furvescens DSM 4134]
MNLSFKDLLSWLMAVVLLSACTDFFEKEVYVEMPPHEPKLVLNGLVDESDSAFRLLITRTSPPNGQTNTALYEAGAQPAVKQNGMELVGALNEQYHWVYPCDIKPGDTFEVLVNDDDLPSASSSVSLPNPANLLKAELDGIRYDIDGYEYSAIKFEMVDEKGVDNFYEVFLMYEETAGYEDSVYVYRSEIGWIQSPIPWLEESSRGLVFTDAAFKDGEVSLEIWYDYYHPDFKYYVGVRSVSESYYEYMRKYEIHQWNQYPDLFSGEPVPMYNNISGGYGLLAAFTSTVKKIEE